MSQEQAQDVFLTDEVRAKLKGSLGFQVEAAFKYVPKAFRDGGIPREMWPVWTLKSKNGVQAATIEDEAGYLELESGSSTSKFRPQSGSMRLETLRKGIIAVERFLLEDGTSFSWDSKTKDMVFHDVEGKDHIKNNKIVDKVIEHMTPSLQVELQNAINERATLTPDELRGLE